MASSLEAYRGKPLALVPVVITNEMVDTVTRRLLGAAGAGGADLVRLQHWLPQFGAESMGIWNIVGEFGDWMANGRPPWAAYRALLLGCLIGLYKCPMVRLVVVRETWRRMLENFVLVVMGTENKEACGTDHLCYGLDMKN